MPERQHTTMAALIIGDYIESQQDGSVWKVTHERNNDGQVFLGITNAEGHRRGPIPADDTPVLRLEYGTPLTEEQVAAELGAVLVTHDGPSWFHPPHSAFDDNEHMLRGHLVRFHFAALAGLDPAEARLGDLVVIHHAEHNDGKSDHTHGE